MHVGKNKIMIGGTGLDLLQSSGSAREVPMFRLPQGCRQQQYKMLRMQALGAQEVT